MAKMHLGFFGTTKELNVVYNKHVYQLIEVNKIVDGIVAAMVLELIDELFTAHIQHHFSRMRTLYFVTNSLC